MFVDDAVGDFFRHRVIPDAFGIDDGDGPVFTDAQAVGLAAERAVTGGRDALLHMLPDFVGLLFRRAFGLGLIGANEDVAIEFSDAEISGDCWQIRDFAHVDLRTEGVTLYSDKVGVRLSREQFDAIVEAAIAQIPGKFRARMENLVMSVEDWGPSRDLLGLFEDDEGPKRIRIFQRAHEEMARNEAELRRIVTDTVWHEVGHYFGLDERQVHAIENRRERLRGLRALRRR